VIHSPSAGLTEDAWLLGLMCAGIATDSEPTAQEEVPLVPQPSPPPMYTHAVFGTFLPPPPASVMLTFGSKSVSDFILNWYGSQQWAQLQRQAPSSSLAHVCGFTARTHLSDKQHGSDTVDEGRTAAHAPTDAN
jgi:hypothetical protein